MSTYLTRSARLTVRLNPVRRTELHRTYLRRAELAELSAELWRAEGDSRYAEQLEAIGQDYRRAAEALA